MIRTLFSLALIFAATGALASEVHVEGRIYSSNQCRYFTASLADFRITYHNDEIPADSRVILHTAFHDQSRGQFWSKASVMEMHRNTADTWQVGANQITVIERGEYYADTLELVFEITSPDGTRTWDNGGVAPYGHYAASLSLRAECTPGEFQGLTVRAYAPGDRTEH